MMQMRCKNALLQAVAAGVQVSDSSQGERKQRPMSSVEAEVREALYALGDPEYKKFHSGLIPNIAPERIIGVRTPALRKFAKEFAKSEHVAEFLQALPHASYEENNLHGFLIEGMKEYDTCIAALNAFLPWVDNWATCDMVSPKVFKKNREKLIGQIRIWMASDHTYTIRFGIGMLMRLYLDDGVFTAQYPQMVADIRSQEYYVNMMIAWYFATALAKQYETVLPYVEERRLPVWVHNKTIQKAVESSRITKEAKAYLRSLRIKEKKQTGISG